MKGGKRPLGYTIIEVMIVLAVSGVMFLIAADFISGKQERTSFTEGVNQMASNIQDTIQQVTSGQYSDIGLNCTFTPPANTNVTTGSNAQGTNASCVFLGKLLHLSESVVGVTGSHNYETFSLAGGLVNPSTVGSAVTLANVDPVAIPAPPQQSTPQGLDVTNMKITPLVGSPPLPGPPVTNYSVGFIQSLGSSNSVGSFQSGGQTISMVYGAGIAAAGMSSSLASGAINGNIAYAQKAQICLSDGTQTAELTIGANNNQLSVDVKQLGKGVVVCP